MKDQKARFFSASKKGWFSREKRRRRKKGNGIRIFSFFFATPFLLSPQSNKLLGTRGEEEEKATALYGIDPFSFSQ